MARYLARHPSAVRYAGFGDFNLYRVIIERAHLVAGFGRIHWIEAGDLLLDISGSRPLATAEPAIVEHMNRDHCDAVGLFANVLLGLGDVGWCLTGCDPEGVDLRLGGRVARLAFDRPVETAEQAGAELTRLARQARQKDPPK